MYGRYNIWVASDLRVFNCLTLHSAGKPMCYKRPKYNPIMFQVGKPVQLLWLLVGM